MNVATPEPRNSANAIASPCEMQIPESFHRIKRTLLLLASGLILLAFSSPPSGGQSTITVPIINASMPTIVAKVFLTVALSYYAVGFLVEFLAAWRSHGSSLTNAEVSGHEQRVRNLADEVETYADTLKIRGEKAFEELDGALAALEAKAPAENLPFTLEQAIEIQISSRAEGDNLRLKAMSKADRERYYEDIRQRVTANWTPQTLPEPPWARQPRLARSTLETAKEEVSILRSEMDLVLSAIRRAHSTTVRLSSRIRGERQFGFFWWEGAGAATAFVAAMVLAWSGVAPVFSSRLVELESPTPAKESAATHSATQEPASEKRYSSLAR